MTHTLVHFNSQKTRLLQFHGVSADFTPSRSRLENHVPSLHKTEMTFKKKRPFLLGVSYSSLGKAPSPLLRADRTQQDEYRQLLLFIPPTRPNLLNSTGKFLDKNHGKIAANAPACLPFRSIDLSINTLFVHLINACTSTLNKSRR